MLEQGFREERFVPNDTPACDPAQSSRIASDHRPEHGRQEHLYPAGGSAALLAHTGSFIPADEARIDLIDRIFTRIGASDDLARGQSTFMVEMCETANILNNATAAA